jgi:hypothetical protein
MFSFSLRISSPNPSRLHSSISPSLSPSPSSACASHPRRRLRCPLYLHTLRRYPQVLARDTRHARFTALKAEIWVPDEVECRSTDSMSPGWQPRMMKASP